MRIVVEGSVDRRGQSLVRFSAPCGVGLGRWVGDAVPALGAYDVEFEVDRILRWRDDVNFADRETPFIAEVDGAVCYGGKVELVAGELVTLRLGEGLFSFEVDGVVGLKVGEQLVACVQPSDIEIYPYDL
jgi:hypothetical protein